ncbi:MAG: hypothetical protein DMF68_18940 [Acidobacteria bacterium]|nr:MAG: hypothetical protein DMF68_18940 [Acidobacteriota bacterium]
MLRAAALSLFILVSIAVVLPLVDSSAHNSGRATARHSHMRYHHSRAWWRRHRARLRRERAAMLRKQSLEQTRKEGMNPEADSHNSNHVVYGNLPAVSNEIKTSDFKPSASASALSLPNGWVRRTASANGETKFVISASDGQYIGAATLSLINAHASGESFVAARASRRTLGGVPLTELRRSVIDKMISSNGWVVNDITREIEGKPAFIVLAQTAASTDGRTPQLSWVFLFTEVDGRIYGLSASSLSEFSDRIADDSAQLMASFLANSRRVPTESSLR